MQRHNYQQLDSFSGMSTGKMHTRIPAGTSIKELFLELDGVAASSVTRVEVEINGDAIVNASGVDLQMLQRYKGAALNSNVIKIPFCDYSQHLQQGQNLSELVTLRGENVVLRVELDAPGGIVPAKNF